MEKLRVASGKEKRAGRKGYSGTATLTRIPLIAYETQIGDERFDCEGRFQFLEFPNFFFINTYVPNAKSDLSRLDERQEFDKLLLQNPEKEQYSWWSYRGGVRENNVGWRIDYFLATHTLLPLVQSATIHDHVTGSDHCPVELCISTPQQNRDLCASRSHPLL